MPPVGRSPSTNNAGEAGFVQADRDGRAVAAKLG